MRARQSPASAHAASSRARIVHSMQLSCFSGTVSSPPRVTGHTQVSKAGCYLTHGLAGTRASPEEHMHGSP